ncbi:hypothetical protein [uncultured Victivallis sp.]|uniref:hypothetical protein n=1 Tax=uncultured Victivallis sp. TaxID=354118 RepID=UPI002597B607|nr:hypothetical protein [uncultured Victivallis sp.]
MLSHIRSRKPAKAQYPYGKKTPEARRNVGTTTAYGMSFYAHIFTIPRQRRNARMKFKSIKKVSFFVACAGCID